jgi:hypothetical protein
VVNEFIKSLLCKKVNQRSCDIQKLKTSAFFIDFNWDSLIDFKIKPPYLPDSWDWTKNINNIFSPFEMILKVNYNIYLIFN